ncbi:MAG: exosome complex RNA-binding protein Csl4, partial [Candidatus Micrarchaeota archaeon]|nr:exosome complex RNA-binding protein Csl4 [Candidatus Micrarchaeota archaeon]
LGTEEEFIPGNGTRTDKDGNIRAVNAGIVSIDENRRISVVSDREPQKIKPGDVVYGRIEELFDSVAFLTIEHPNSAETERVDRMSAIIPISEIKEGFVKSIRDEIRVGDIIVGVVKEVTPLRVIVSLKSKGMGVVMAYCSYDRKPMVLKGRTLVCSKCNQKESRIIAENYGKFEYIETAELIPEGRKIHKAFQRGKIITKRPKVFFRHRKFITKRSRF